MAVRQELNGLTWAGRRARVCLPSLQLPRGTASSTTPTPSQASISEHPSPSSPGTGCPGTAPDGSLALGTKATLCPALGWLQAG